MREISGLDDRTDLPVRLVTDPMKRIGFSLIELVVVVGILALLLAILLPVFASVRRKGQQTACQSNLHQIHIACALYAQDENGFLPPYPTTPMYIPGTDGQNTADQSDLLLKVLSPYVHSRSIWHCPSDFSRHVQGKPREASRLLVLTSYLYDGFRITTQGITLMRIDGTESVSGLRNDPASWPLLRDSFSCPSDVGYPQYNHDGRWNQVFLDGHATSFTVDCSNGQHY